VARHQRQATRTGTGVVECNQPREVPQPQAAHAAERNEVNEHCKKLVLENNKLLAHPERHSLANFAEEIYEQGYIVGKEMERKLLRIKLGLNVPADLGIKTETPT
jgi:hypothetical protein